MSDRIAILIPAYNAASYLPGLFRTIREQTIPLTKIICYDDCSSDDTAEVAERLGAIVVRATENRGAAYSRNRLLEKSSSDWVHFHDADDLLDLSFVEECKKKFSGLKADKHNTCLISDMRVLNQAGDESFVKYNQQLIATDPIDYFLKNNGYSIIGCYPKQVLQKIGGFNQELRGNEDPDLHIRLAAYGADFLCIEKPLVTNLVRPGSFSALNWLKCMRDRFKCLDTYSKKLAQKYHPEIARQAAELSNYFYREGDKEISKKARNLALQLGIKKLKSSKFATLSTTYFGVPFYLWLYRRRVDLKLI